MGTNAASPELPPERINQGFGAAEYLDGLFKTTFAATQAELAATRRSSNLTDWLAAALACGTFALLAWASVALASSAGDFTLQDAKALGLKVCVFFIVAFVWDRVLVVCRENRAQINHLLERIYAADHMKQMAATAAYSNDSAGFQKVLTKFFEQETYPKLNGNVLIELERARQARARVGSGITWMFGRVFRRTGTAG
jgi:hypothetical protein